MSASDPAPVTIIIPSRDRPRSARRAVESAASSGVSEIIVVDDHSTSSLSEELRDLDGVRVVESSGRGVCAARNTGARMAAMPWIGFLDDDDRRVPVQGQLGSALHDPGAGLIAGAARLVDDRAREHPVVAPKDLGPSFGHLRASVLAGSWIIRREWFLSRGGYAETLRHSENTELFLRLAEDVEVGLWDAVSVAEVFVEVLSDPTLVRASRNDAAKVDAVAYMRERHHERLRRDPAVLSSTLRAGAVAAVKTGNRRVALSWLAECVARGDRRAVDALRFGAAAVPGLDRLVWDWSTRVGRRVRQPARDSARP